MNRAIGGGYHEDERGHYVFSYSDNDGKHVDVRFRAESDYDLDIVFSEFKNFLIASGHDVEGPIGELTFEEDDSDDEPTVFAWTHEDGPMERTQFEPKDEVHAMTQAQSADKFSMDHLPNNGWPFGGLTTSPLPALSSQSFNQFPTMAPLTSQQVQSWSLSSDQIQALTTADLSMWRVDAPGTLGGAKVTF